MDSTSGAASLPPNPSLAVPSKEDRTLAMVLHLSALAGHLFPFANILVPLIIWMVKRDTSPFIDDQGKEVVNAHISFMIYAIVSLVLCFVIIGFFLLIALYVGAIVTLIKGAIAANEGRAYRYPYILRFVN